MQKDDDSEESKKKKAEESDGGDDAKTPKSNRQQNQHQDTADAELMIGASPPPPPPSTISSPRRSKSTTTTTTTTSNTSIINNNSNSSSNNNKKDTFRRVQRVSRHAAERTKQAVWDTNELSITAALSAVDHWESLYNALRGLIVHSADAARGVYRTTKEGAERLEHGLLAPVRDWILLPAFSGAERAVEQSATFCQSDTARQIVQQSLRGAANVPYLGQPVLEPALRLTGVALQQTWHVLQYPIPSPHQVRSTVDWTLNTTKWALATAARSIVLYAKRADANITRTLSHTQWKVLGSGPYATLDDSNKAMVLDHLCERYFDLLLNTTNTTSNTTNSPVPRYELAAHIKRHNALLYTDLKVMLQQRGTEAFADDEWLCDAPVYYQTLLEHGERPFLLLLEQEEDYSNNNNKNKKKKDDTEEEEEEDAVVSALWFRLPNNNGKRPAKDAPWICFSRSEQVVLEQHYQQILHTRSLHHGYRDEDVQVVGEQEEDGEEMDGVDVQQVDDLDSKIEHGIITSEDQTQALTDSALNDKIVEDKEISTATHHQQQREATSSGPTPKKANRSSSQRQSSSNSKQQSSSPPPPPTIAQWYKANPATDILVDQKRHAVSFFWSCPKCRRKHEPVPVPLAPKQYGDLCDDCAAAQTTTHTATTISSGNKTTTAIGVGEKDSPPLPAQAASVGLPPIAMIMRPTFWRFYGEGDQVRRATWFLDTPRHGLQPFDEEAHAVLEDAYLFLKWMSVRRIFEAERHQQHHGHNTNNDDDDDDGNDESGFDEALLTVEVPCPDGAERLVQFNSLKQATAIQKGLGAAVTLFKRRVYRGAWLYENNKESSATTTDSSDSVAEQQHQRAANIQEAIAKATEHNGSLGETNVPDASIRSILAPPSPLDNDETRVVLYQAPDVDCSLAVPPERLAKPDMAKRLKDKTDGKIEHLCLIVHGIGEMLRSIDLFGLSLPDLTSVCGSMRNNHAEVLDANFAQMYPTADATSRASTGRVEYLPVEWHESFSILTQRRAPSVETGDKPNVMIKDISLRTIPNMREFANDTLMDVLFFMSPEHHDVIIDVVTHECNLVVEKFRQTTGFNGSISIVGHSLGSIIAWDILNNQNIGFSDPEPGPLRNVASIESIGTGYFSTFSDRSDNPEVTSSIRASQERSTYPQLDFSVDNFFLLGSPVAVFLMIRNQRTPLSDDFYLRGCHRVFNIFHPYDPVAYRIEPCIDPRNADFEPTIIKHWNGGFRVQYQTRRLWRKFVETTSKTQRNVVEAFEQSMAGLGLLDATVDAGTDDDSASEASHMSENHCVITGLLNQSRRIDYLLQEREIENANEYVAALAAHSSYWMEKDLSLFIARQIYLSSHEHASADGAAADLGASWESISPEDIKM